MIIKGEFTDALRRQSHRYFYLYSFLNGISYMCLGETVVMLLAVQLDCPDYIVAAIGAMIYVSYILLPLGKLVASHIGAAPSQAFFWVLRNCAALFVASSALWNHYGHHGTAVAVLLAGTFVFYSCRAAGCVMIVPLIGNITTKETRESFIGLQAMLFYASELVALVGIFLYLNSHTGIWPIAALICTGAVFGFTSAYFIKNIHETDELKKTARDSFFRSIKENLRNHDIRQLLVVHTAVNMAISMVCPVVVLTLKRGYGLSDKDTLLYTVMQMVGSILFAKLAGNLAKKIGNRRAFILSYAQGILLCIYWIVCPSKALFLFIAPAFLVIGSFKVTTENTYIGYFLTKVSPKRQVNASIMISTVAGYCGGIIATFISGLILDKLLAYFSFSDPLLKYKCYFAIAAVIVAPCIWPLLRLSKDK
ncbi:MAG: MFS transporter [Victivallales bacterium]|nr:MFS transporter [Victivallales bacterium]